MCVRFFLDAVRNDKCSNCELKETADKSAPSVVNFNLSFNFNTFMDMHWKSSLLQLRNISVTSMLK